MKQWLLQWVDRWRWRDPQDEQVLAAVTQGDVSACAQALAAGGSPNVRDAKGVPALVKVLGHDRLALGDLLLSHPDVKVNLASREGETALMLAAKNHQTVILETLIDKGASLDHQDRHGDTALSLAAYHGHEEAVQILVKHGANLTLRNTCGMTAEEEAATGSIQEGPHPNIAAFLCAAQRQREGLQEEVPAFRRSRLRS
jgi:uncharacterized protein